MKDGNIYFMFDPEKDGREVKLKMIKGV